MGNPYPAEVVDSNGNASKGVLVNFTDANNQPGGAAAFALLASTTLGADGTFDVSGLAQTYSDLQLVAVVRGTDAGATDALRLRFNNDSTAGHYHSQDVRATNAAASGAFLTAGTSINVAPVIASAGIGAGLFTTATVYVPGYASTTWQKQLWTLAPFMGSDTDNGAIALAGGGQWLVTTAVNRVQLFGAATANLLAGSQLRIYGVL